MENTPAPDTKLEAPLWGLLRALPPRQRYAHAALQALPRLLGLLDRNPLSPTYGSFDRAYWHYRTMDFPCGMAQEFLLPLALAHSWEIPGGEAYRGQPRLRELCLAAMHFARTSSHRDGTCDDYFPFERAMGALVFSLYAMTEACLVLRLKEEPRAGDDLAALLEFFARRGDHLGRENETGQLANHQALAALALYNVYLLTGEERFRKWADERRELTLSWQHPDGWFQEYEGADPGYHSCSISFLGKLLLKSPENEARLVEPLKRAADFAWNFLHPDGSYAGEYGSRNTFHFYQHGFELLAARGHAKSAQIVDRFLERSLPGGRRYYNDDDRMCAHYVYEWLFAWRDFSPRRSEHFAAEGQAPPETSRAWFAEAGLAVYREPEFHLVTNLRKGGVLKATTAQGAWISDTGPMLQLAGGKVLVAHLMKPAAKPEPAEAAAYTNDPERGVCQTAGTFDRRKRLLPGPWKQILFRLGTLTVGRFNANLVRSTLQKILITGKAPSPYRFQRNIEVSKDSVVVEDRLSGPVDARVERVVIGTDTTSIYVANSNTYQASTLLPCTDVPGAATLLSQGRAATIRRRYTLAGGTTPEITVTEATPPERR